MCWGMILVQRLLCLVSVAGCLGYDVLVIMGHSMHIIFLFQLLVV